MVEGRTVLAVVPARGGSKGIPLKNLREVAGRSLLANVGSVIREVPEIDRAVVSTDDPAIAREAEKAGIAAPFWRPKAISGDYVGDVDVLTHALLATEALDGKTYDIVVMLQPTSPLRKASDVSATIGMLVEGGWDSVWTVSHTESKAHPLKQLTISKGALDYYDQSGAQIVARQQLLPVYHRNGVAYAFLRACLLDQRTIKGKRTGALIIEGHHISIDTEWDLELVEFLLARQAAEAGLK
jgi:CMP-N,N'-diacetyllegionaminic acid synthase